jgi:hydrogenase maturation protease
LLGLKPGEVRLYDAQKVAYMPSISTHSLSIRVFCDYLTQLAQTKIALLLIEPQNTDFGEGLSEAVAQSAKHVTSTLLTLLP